MTDLPLQVAIRIANWRIVLREFSESYHVSGKGGEKSDVNFKKYFFLWDQMSL